MVKVVGVRFKKAGKIYYFDPADNQINKGDSVIVETARGIEFGECVIGPKEISEEEMVAPLKSVLRRLQKKMLKYIRKIRIRKRMPLTCINKIKEHNLEMKLIDVEYTFDNNKVIFYFTADGRVDFRELVKDLATILRPELN